jgi:hypothetical protein
MSLARSAPSLLLHSRLPVVLRVKHGRLLAKPIRPAAAHYLQSISVPPWLMPPQDAPRRLPILPRLAPRRQFARCPVPECWSHCIGAHFTRRIGGRLIVTWRVLMNRRHVLHAMRLLRVREPSDHSEFIFAPKIDGFRAVCTSKGAAVDSCRGTAASQVVAAALRGDRERCPVSVGRLDEV